MVLREQLNTYLHPWSEGDPPTIYYTYLKGDHIHKNDVNRY